MKFLFFLLFLSFNIFSGELPIDEYEHKNFQEQIKRYRDAVGENYNELHLHKEKLWPIALDAFKIVIWYLDNWPKERLNILKKQGIENIEYKIPEEQYEKTLPVYKEDLKKLWDISLLVKEKTMLCPASLRHIIGRLSLLSESYQKQISTDEILNNIKSAYKDTDTLEEYRLSPSFEVFTKKCEESYNYYPIIPILGNPKKKSTGIALSTFVEEHLNELPAHLALFNVLLEDTSVFNEKNPQKGFNLPSKKQSHYGLSEGPAMMYLHDLRHRDLYFLTRARFKEHYLMFIRLLGFAYDKKETMDDNDKKIVTNGIFILFHEEFSILYEYCLINNKIEEIMTNPIAIVAHVMDQMKSAVHDIDRYSYKERNRDLEHILFDKKNPLKDDKAQLLKGEWKNFSKETNKKERDECHVFELKEAYDRFWHYWIKLVSGIEIKMKLTPK